MMPPCLSIQYGSAHCKILLPSSPELFEQLIRREFMLENHIQLGLTMVPNTESEDERNDGTKAEAVVVPIDLSVLKELASGNVFQLRIYHSSPNPSSSSHNSSALLSTVVAQYDFKGASASELSFLTGDLIHVEYQYNKDWVKGRLVSKSGQFLSSSGFFPSEYVSKLPPFSETSADEAADVSSGNCNFQDDEYFEGYSHLGIHLEMLQDKSRTLAYKKAVELASNTIKDKIVLDIGCGSGVLSLFCANAGAKHVYAIDASNVIEHARVVVEENKLSEKITLIKGKIEDVKLPVEKVDIIISEWMGTLLICESMIASVLWARSFYLAEGGLMMPSVGNIFLAPLDLTEFYGQKIGFWDDVYGLKMSGLKKQAIDDFFSKPIFDRIINENECLDDAALIYSIDMHTANVDSLESMMGSFDFLVSKDVTLHGFGGWFDCEFIAARNQESSKITLSTCPSDVPTHWRQVTFVLASPVALQAGTSVRGTMQIRRQAFWRRHFEVDFRFTHGEGEQQTVYQVFPLWR